MDVLHVKDKELRELLSNASGVINCIGIMNPKKLFDALHFYWPKRLATICGYSGVNNLIHLSAIGVDVAAGSAYAESKYKGEQAILSVFPKATILRPSVIFGFGDNFLGMFAKLAKIVPFIPLIGGGRTKMQPVFVGDVANAAVLSLQNEKYEGQVFCLGGSDILSLREIIEKIILTTESQAALLSLPFCISMLLARFLQILPKPLLTVDQVKLLKYDNVVVNGDKTLTDFNITPTSMQQMLPNLLQAYTTGGRWKNRNG